MQGYIIDIKKVRDDDLIVSILTKYEIYTTYRFYGARHSIINIGYKIDFELETNIKSTIPRLKDVIQVGYKWIFDYEKLYCFTQYLKLFSYHFKNIENIDSFYFDSIENLVTIINKQNPKRAICEHYIKVLEFEGRLPNEFYCLLCDKKIENNISLIRSFMTTHSNCSYGKEFPIEKIKDLFINKSLILFDNNEVQYLYNIILQGI